MIKAMIVDDEAPARDEMRFLLDEVGGVEVQAEASNVRDAIEQLRNERVDVIFLDINMPGVDGMQFAEALSALKMPPLVVFVTAYSEHALSAFKVNAIDYLVKPVETERLVHTINKINRILEHNKRTVQGQKRIPVDKNGRKILVEANRIRFIMAKDDYSCIHSIDERYLTPQSLASLEEELSESGFFRAHRRYLVNLAYISEVENVSGGTLLLSVKDESEKIPVSRRRVSLLKKVLGI